ncbi:MAG TPA: DUF559 domain-containing protein [Phenylobacterium sp.]
MAHQPKRALARSFRRRPSETERLLWKLLRDRRLEGYKFRRQVPLGPYVVDFACLRPRLVVEADGPFHDAAYDDRRDAFLQEDGFRVLRFPNDKILLWPDYVVDAIAEALGCPEVHLGEGRRLAGLP